VKVVENQILYFFRNQLNFVTEEIKNPNRWGTQQK